MPRTAFLFPGQGAQTVGMGKVLAETVPAARALYEEASRILGYDLLEVCVHGPVEKLNTTAVSQPAIFVSSLAALEKLRLDDPSALEACEATAGLSLGEYSALVFAGALTFTDGIRVVQQRGEAMQEAADATPGGMVSILGMEDSKVEELCRLAGADSFLQVANLLCPGNIVLSGTKIACQQAEQLVEAAGGRAKPLAVAGAFHTELMKPADEKLAQALASVPLQTPRIPVWSNVDARPHTDADEIRDLLVRQVVQPVLMEPLLRDLLETGCERFYEIGPGRVLAALLKRIHRRVEVHNISA